MKKKGYKTAVVLSMALSGVLLSGCSASVKVPDTVKVQNVEGVSNVITVTGKEEVKVIPDMAQIVYGVYTRTDTVDACQKENNEKVNQTIAKLKELGVAETSIQTSAYGLNPIYNYQSDKREVVGYEMRTQITVSDIPIDNAGDILSKSVETGVNEIQSVSYFSSSYDASYQEALKGAMEMAKAKAQSLAEAGGKKVKGVSHIEEYGYNPGVRYASYNGAMAGAAKAEAAADIPLGDIGTIMPGEVSVEAQVVVTFEME